MIYYTYRGWKRRRINISLDKTMSLSEPSLEYGKPVNEVNSLRESEHSASSKVLGQSGESKCASIASWKVKKNT